MDEQIINVIDALCEKFGIVIDWTQGNVLPYLQELCTKYIRYEIATSIVWCVLLVFVTTSFYIAANKFHKKVMTLEYQYCESDPIVLYAIVAWICTVILAIISIPVIIMQTLDIITCLAFPEKMIIEFANSLLK